MENVLYIPLDDRECNVVFPQKIAELTDCMSVIVPPTEMLGRKKEPADIQKLWTWIFKEAPKCRYAILSVDMLVYGNLIHSRIHHRTLEQCMDTMNNFRKLKKLNPGLEIHAFSLVTRVAAYNSANEDPDYWADYGRMIWEYTVLSDKQYRNPADESVAEQKKALEKQIPKEVLGDFLNRRKINRQVNLECIELTKENIFEMLTIPKDDTAEFGYAAMDQKVLSDKTASYKIFNKVLVYPGADEVGSILTARVFHRITGSRPRIYVRYSSVRGAFVVPKYEDRPLGESIKAQIISMGGLVADTAKEADCMLAVNASGTEMIEAAVQDNKDAAFIAGRNLWEFMDYINDYYRRYHRPIGLADVSTANGCEKECMEYGLNFGIFDKIQSVGGWNTAANTIGVVLAHLAVCTFYHNFKQDKMKQKLSEQFKYTFLIKDWLYQSEVLSQFLKETAGKVEPYELKGHYEETLAYFQTRLAKKVKEVFGEEWTDEKKINLDSMGFDWDGVFYIRFWVKFDE